jgi:hypothetical protein
MEMVVSAILVLIVIIVLFLILSSIIVIIRNEITEMRIINIILSKLEFCPTHYKIIRKDNKIIIKCHYYTREWSNLLYKTYGDMMEPLNKIIKNDEGFYTYNNITLINYDSTKNIGIISYDILIDMRNKNYKIITSYFEIINCIRDDDNLYEKIITYLETPSFYISINNIYDNNLNFVYDYDEALFEPFYYKFNQQKKHYLYNPHMKFNITITNDKEFIYINPILYKKGNFPNFIIEMSRSINSKPHITPTEKKNETKLYKIIKSISFSSDVNDNIKVANYNLTTQERFVVFVLFDLFYNFQVFHYFSYSIQIPFEYFYIHSYHD